MGKNVVRLEFLSDGTWTAPGGVSQVSVTSVNYLFSQLSAIPAAIDAVGNAYAWGDNLNGQLGQGDVVPRSSPVLVINGFKWRQIAGFYNAQACFVGIANTGDAYAWGFNLSGELGLGDVVPRSSPVLVLGGFKWRQVSAANPGSNLGGTVVGINSSGDGYAWGRNAFGQLGLGDVIPRSSPVVILGSHKWRQVATSSAHCLGIDSNGDAYAWGSNSTAELGLGDIIPRSSPILVLGSHKWRQIATGVGVSCGIDINGDGYAWGFNSNGQLGLGDTVQRSSPVLILGSHKWKQLSTSTNGMIGITTDGDAYAWGINTNGQLGVGDVIPRSTPTLVLGSLKYFRVQSGSLFNTAIDSNGSVYAWGVNTSGQLAQGTVVPKSSPVIIIGGASKYSSVYQVRSNTVVIDVVPGTTYNLAVFGTVAYFDYHGIYQDPYSSGAIPTKLILEYEA